jgi:hypothetical protein
VKGLRVPPNACSWAASTAFGFSMRRSSVPAARRRGVVIRTVINNMTFDRATKDPIQQALRDALIAFIPATA